MSKPKTGKFSYEKALSTVEANRIRKPKLPDKPIATLAEIKKMREGCTGCSCKSMAERAVADNDIYHQGLVKGRSELLAEQKFAKPCTDKFDELLEKQAYEKGVEKGLDMKWELCRKRTSTKAVADFKARLISDETVAMVDWKGLHQYEIRNFIKQLVALAEATKGGDGK